MLSVQTTTGAVADKLRARLEWPKRAGQVLTTAAPAIVTEQASAKASTLRRKDGTASRLGYALLRTPSVDPLYQWQPQTQLTTLTMSKWARRASGSMYTLFEPARQRLLHDVLSQLGRS